MFKNIEAVIFDMDGTLVDSMWVWAQVDVDFLGERNLEMPPNLQKDIEGLSFEQTADYFLEKFPLNMTRDELMTTWVNMCQQSYKTKVGYKPGAFEFLKYLKSQGIKTGIATSNARELVELVGTSLGFLPYIDAIATSEDVPNGKPAPDIYLNVAKQLGVEPKNCFVFEDVPNGIRAGIHAGMHTCAIYDKATEYADEEKRELADYYIKDYHQILERLE